MADSLPILNSDSDDKLHLLDLKEPELIGWLAELKQPKFRADQVLKWLYQSRVETFDEMSNLPATLREELDNKTTIWTSRTIKHSVSDDGTEKLLLGLRDGGVIECVLLRDGPRRSICISTQVGCAMGCVFCASGLDGVDRNLTTGEILEQMLKLQRLLPDEERLSHIVVMGMGEPLANLDRLLPALEVASSPTALGISARRITISTVGLPAAMQRLTQQETRYHLAVSLHAPNNELRTKIVPVNPRAGLESILSAADDYFEMSHRRMTYEYVLLAEVNDRPEHAQQLVALLRGRSALLNVIPYNPVAGLPYRTPTLAAQNKFKSILESGGINVQFRVRKGDDINAACGQLRRTQLS